MQLQTVDNKKGFKSADAVISGEIISFTATSDLDSFGVRTTCDTSSFAYKFEMCLNQYVYRLKVDKIFKGTRLSDTVIVIIPANGCGLIDKLEVGKHYVIYATNEDETLRTKEMLKFADVRRQSISTKTFFTSQCLRVAEEIEKEEEYISYLTK